MTLRTVSALVTLTLGSCFVLGACDAGGEGSEESFATSACKSAYIDDDGYCRAQNGTFASASCCASASACNSAALDADGVCRKSNGQFAPTACCDEICGGAELDDDGFCRRADGRFAKGACCADECAAAEKRGDDSSELPTCNGQSGVECELKASMECLECAKDECITDVLDPDSDCAPYVACLNECGCDDDTCRFNCEIPGPCTFVIEDLNACMTDDCEASCPLDE